MSKRYEGKHTEESVAAEAAEKFGVSEDDALNFIIAVKNRWHKMLLTGRCFEIPNWFRYIPNVKGLYSIQITKKAYYKKRYAKNNQRPMY